MTQSQTILYVEDDAVTLTAYKNRLEQKGYIVQTAQDGVEALKYLYKSKPDVLLLDLVLPRLTGEDVLKIVYSDARLRDIPVIVLSTNSTLTVANEHLVEKAEKQLLKQSCTFDRLYQTIEEVLAKANVSNVAGVESGAKKTEPVVAMPLNQTGQVIQELKDQMQVVCAWTGRVKVDEQWMSISDFLSKRLNLTVTHGMSPEAVEKFLRGVNN
jgi:CheY-like chemotaxis protein